MHPFWRGLLEVAQEVVIKGGEAAAESVLEDVDSFTQGVQRKVRRAKERVKTGRAQRRPGFRDE